MKEVMSPGSFSGRFGGEGSCSSGNFKVYASKREKKRPRSIVSDSDVDSDSDDDLPPPPGFDRCRLSSSSKKNRLDYEERIDIRRIGTESDAPRIRGAGVGKRDIHDNSVVSTSSDKRKLRLLEFQEEGDSISDVIKRYKDAKHDRKRDTGVRTERQKDSTGISKFSKSHEVNKKKTKIESMKLEENEETAGTWGISPKYAVSKTKLRKDETNRSFKKRTLIHSLANGSSVTDGNQHPDCFSSKTCKHENDDNDELVGQGDKFVGPSERNTRLQGRGRGLQLKPKNRVPGGFQNTCQNEVAENGKRSLATGKCQKHELNVAMLPYDKDLKNHANKSLSNGKSGAQFFETQNVEDSSEAESGGTDSGSFNTHVKCKRERSPLLVRSLLCKSKGEPKNGLEKAKLKKPIVREKKVKERLGSNVAKLKNHKNVLPSNGKRKIHDVEKEEDDTSSESDSRSIDLGGSGRNIKSKGESRQPLARRTNANSSKKEPNDKGNCSVLLGLLKERGSQKGRQTEKQFLRDHIKNMLLNIGWTIDMRPRRGRTYSDHVYISPSGTEYWSITKAYYALEKQFNGQGNVEGTITSFSAIPVELLSILTRKTLKKKIREEKEKKKKLKFENANKDVKLKIRKKLKLGSRDLPGAKRQKVKIKAKASTEMSEEASKATSIAAKGTTKRAGSRYTSLTSDSNLLQGKKNKGQRGYALLVRSSNKGMDPENNGSPLYPGKLTVLSWLIDSGTVPENGKVQYMNKKRTRAMLDGWVTREGIHCSCCSKILTVSKFEVHAGSKLRQPFQNIFLGTGVSLLQCQLEAWELQEEAGQKVFHFVETDGDDPYDDTCAICGDGGDLICCDSCPSTFHQNCLNIKVLPPGEWHCPNCICSLCGLADGEDSSMNSCSQCERKYHQVCSSEVDATAADSHNLCLSFCGRSCRKLYEGLQRLLGVKNELEGGFSWTLVQRLDENSEKFPRGLALRAELNCKLAVSLAVMDECFLPIVDRRSGVNLIHNVIYSCGSNFDRLNFNGFYTVVLEKGDEFISAATIRIRGTRLAEMPFVGTRNMYRRQGMCRRLLNAIELALSSLNVEILVIPAIAELMHTWTQVFGFEPLQDVHRLEMRSSNMLVFPGTDMLEKSLLKKDILKGGDMIEAAVATTSTVRSCDGSIEAPNLLPESVDPDVHGPVENVLESRKEMENRDVATETSLSVFNGPTCVTLLVVDNPSDTAHGSNFQIDDAGVVGIEASSVKPYAVTPEIITQYSDAASEFACQASGEGIASQSLELTSEYHIQATDNDEKNQDDLKFPESSSVVAVVVPSDKAHNSVQVTDKVSWCSDTGPSQMFEAAPVMINCQASAHDLGEMKDGNTDLESCSPDAKLICKISETGNSDVSPGASVLSDNVHVVEREASTVKLEDDAPKIIVQSLCNSAEDESEDVCGIITCQNASSISLPLRPISSSGSQGTCEDAVEHGPELVLTCISTGPAFSSSTTYKKHEAEKLPLPSTGQQLFHSPPVPVEPNLHFVDEDRCGLKLEMYHINEIFCLLIQTDLNIHRRKLVLRLSLTLPIDVTDLKKKRKFQYFDFRLLWGEIMDMVVQFGSSKFAIHITECHFILVVKQYNNFPSV
ncbi:hypothetical protein H6P81_004894 [Aristolochia fimbriata]|uniref:PHD-type domain-containing protein n=1 Tax=Aristolochia fimbriata TaxID=158543 RepID=A0AAV7EV80_ARIFI|nr:hypothetical protein H6P81_004894 [Aristolochia fimbriata]